MLGALGAGFLPAAVPENTLGCSVVLCVSLKALGGKQFVGKGFAALESLLHGRQGACRFSCRSEDGGDAPGVFSARLGVNSSPAASGVEASLTIWKQPWPAIAELLGAGIGFELRGKGAACI